MIARPKGKGFEGVYQHSDSYPTWLGKHLWAAIKERGDVASFLAETIDAHPGGWSSFPELCYCHQGDDEEPDLIMTDESADWLFIEWAYVIDPEARRLRPRGETSGGEAVHGSFRSPMVVEPTDPCHR